MKFFVMLAVLLLRNFYGQKLTGPLDSAFSRWQAYIAKRLSQGLGTSAVFLLSILPLILLLWLLLWWLDGVYWYLPVLGLHLVVVFYALGRRCDLIWISRYMTAWRQADFEAAGYYAAEILDEPINDISDSELHARVVSRLVVFAFDRLFLVLFWYLLLGPVGALLARLTEQAITNARHEASHLVVSENQPLTCCDEQVVRFQQVLHWPAARLMGLTLGLTGKPWSGLRQFAVDLFHWRLSTEVFLNRQLMTGYGWLCQVETTAASYYQRPVMMTEAADEELANLKERVWRSLAVWVAVTALGVIFWS